MEGLTYRARLLALSTLDLGGAGSGNFGHAGRPGQVGGSARGDGGGGGTEAREEGAGYAASAQDAPVLQGVDPAANASQQTAQHLAHWLQRTGSVPSTADLAAAEAELHALPLVHGTTVAGALGALEHGLLSHADMAAHTTEIRGEIDDLKDEIADLLGVPDTAQRNWPHLLVQVEEGITDFGLDRDDEKALIEKVRDLGDRERVLEGTTHNADIKLGLDRFVFMTHGQHHPDYGNVAVLIDNDVLTQPGSFATENDIVMTPDESGGAGVAFGGHSQYSDRRIQNYKNSIVTGDGYYATAAAKAGSLVGIEQRNRLTLFEVKTPRVPSTAVKGFVVQNDEDTARRLADELGTLASRKGSERDFTSPLGSVRREMSRHNRTGKVLYVSDASARDAPHHLRHQLKAMQTTGDWDEDALATYNEQHDGATIHIL